MSGAGELHALGVAAGAAHLVDPRAHDLALLHDDQDLVVLVDRQRTDEVAALARRACATRDAEAAAALDAVLRRPRALGQAVLEDDEHVGVLALARRPTSRAASSPSRNFMPVTPEVARPIGRSASSVAWKRTDWPLRETSSRSSVDEARPAPTSSSPSRRLTAMRPPVRGRVVVAEAGLLDQPALRGEHEVGRLSVVAHREHLGDLLARLERQQVGDVLALAVARPLGQLVGLGAVDAARGW